MNKKTRNEFASYGLEILKKCVLLVLYEETDVVSEEPSRYAQGRILKRREIFKLLKLPYIYIPSRENNCYTLIQGVLIQLKCQRYAHYYNDQGWAITKEGVSVIENLK